MLKGALLALIGMASMAEASTLDVGLVAHYTFDGNANDTSGNGMNGLAQGVTLVSDRFNAINRAYSFSGGYEPESNIKIPGLATGANRTFSSWIWLTGGQDGPRVFSFSPGEMAIDLNVNGLQRININTQTVDGGDGFATGGIDLFNKWTHVVGVWSEIGGAIYTNGSLSAQKTWSSRAITDYSNGFIPEIGGNSGALWDPFGGIIDDVRIYNRALTASEAAEIYTTESVPEPSSLSLLALGGLVVALRRRKK
jgi:Concanavalin A-like lectin/glucanases superfamily/PEP-CTERM motif